MNPETRIGMHVNPASGTSFPEYRNLDPQLVISGPVSYYSGAVDACRTFVPDFLIVSQAGGLSCARYEDGSPMRDNDGNLAYQQTFRARWACDQAGIGYVLDPNAIHAAFAALPRECELIPYVGPPPERMGTMSPAELESAVGYEMAPWECCGCQIILIDGRGCRGGSGADRDQLTRARDRLELAIDRILTARHEIGGCEGYCMPGFPWAGRPSLSTLKYVRDNGWPTPDIAAPRFLLDTTQWDRAKSDEENRRRETESGLEAARHGMVPLFSEGWFRATGMTAERWRAMVQAGGGEA